MRLHSRLHALLLPRHGVARQVHQRHVDRQLFGDHGDGFTVFIFRVAGTQDLVAHDKRTEGRTQRIQIDRAVEPQRSGHVVSGAVSGVGTVHQAVDRPQAPLCRGQAHCRGARYGKQ
ncbi:hypothetical protein D3C71_1154920 [compost metagenome]